MKFFKPLLAFIFVFLFFSNFSKSGQEDIKSIEPSRKLQIAYTISSDSNTITPIHLDTGNAGIPIELPRPPKSLVIDAHAQIAYILSEGSKEISCLDLKTKTFLKDIPQEKILENIVLSKDGQSLFLTYEKSNWIDKVDLTTKVISHFTELKNHPSKLVVSKDDRTLFASYSNSHEVTPIDTQLKVVKPNLFLNESPKAIATAADGRLAIIGDNSAQMISFYDSKTSELTGTISTENLLSAFDRDAQDIHLSLDNSKAYLTLNHSNEIISIDLTTESFDSIALDHSIKNITFYPREELVASFEKKIAQVENTSHFDASSTQSFNGNITSYVWDFGDGHETTTSSPLIAHVYQSPGDFNVTLKVVESIENFPFILLNDSVDGISPLNATASAPVYIPKKPTNSFIEPLLINKGHFGIGAPTLPTSTSTTIDSSAQPSVFGEPITFSSTVSSLIGPGIPTGTVSFVDTTLGTIGSGTLNATGNATYTTSSLAVGTYSLSANYSGDTSYDPSSSSPPQFSQTVNKALTSIALNATPNPSTFGNTVTVTATISVLSPGAGSPTGTVTFKDGATTIGTASVSSGQAVLMSAGLSPGPHSITAVYSGDANFITSTSPAWIQTVNQGTTSTSLTTSLTPSPFGNSVTFTATVAITAGAGVPSGTVTFKDGSTTIGTQTLSSGTAVLSISSLAVGTHNITATYNGDVNFTISTSSPLSQVISQGTTTTSLTSSINPTYYGQSTTFTATVAVATGSGMPSGSVTFFDGATSIGTSSLSGGVATLSINNLSVSTHSITAVYSGDTNFSTSTSSALSQVVGKATPTDVVTSSLSPSNFGDQVTFTATISAPTTLGLPTGTVNFYNGATLIGTSTLSGSGPNTATATFATSTLNAGTLPITAQYSGDGNFLAVTSAIFSQVVNPVTTTSIVIFSNSQNPSEYGQEVLLRATVTGSTASPPFPPTGTVTFYDGTTVIGTSAVNPVPGNPNSGSSSLSITDFSIGPHVITAMYSGDVNYPPSSLSAPMTQTVVKSNTTSAVTTALTPTVFGQSATFTVTVTPVSPGMGTPSGTVAFYDGATFLGNSSSLVPGVNSSTASFSTTVLSLGSHIITGIYGGDVNFVSSSAPVITQTVVQAATNTLITSSSSSPPGFNFGNFITFTATVSAASPGSGTPSGTVTFYDGSTLIGTSTLSGGTASTTTVNLYPSPPPHSITAVFSGDANFIASTSPVFSQVINSTLPTTTTVTSSRNSSPGGASVTYTAQVVANPGPGQGIPGIPTGTVTFTDTTLGLVIGTGTLNANGFASITESGSNLPFIPPAPDIHQIQAVYNGQPSVFITSTSPLFNQYVVPLDTTTTLVATPNHTTQEGVTLVATVNVVGGIPPHPTDLATTVSFYQGTLLLGTVPVQADGTATLMPNNLHFGPTLVTAVYSGNTTQFAMSTSNSLNLQVQQTDMLTTNTTITSSLANSIYCQPVTFTATVVQTQGFYTPTGTVTFFSDDTAIGTAILDDTGMATLTVSTLLVGTHEITATYNSDSNYAFSFANTLQQTVSVNNTSTVLAIIPSLSSTPYGENLILSATVSSTSPYTVVPTGSVTFSHGLIPVGTVPLNSSGNAVYQISTLDTGTYTVTAKYNPDPCFNTSTASTSHTIAPINPQTTLTSTPNPSTYGDNLQLTAMVNSPYGIPTGSVTFYNGSTALGTVFLEGGTASFEIESPPAGFAILKARYNGDTNFLPIMTPSVLQTINKAPTATCLVSFTTNPSTYGQIVSLNATVTSNVPNTLPGTSGTVRFTNGSTLLGTVPLSGCDTAELETTNLNLGSANNIVAIYSGDSNFATSSSTTLNRTVIQSATNTTVTSITSTPNPPTFGTLVTFNVAVSAVSPGSGIPTGTITGFYGTTSLGSGTLINGVASFSTSALPAGVQTIIVKYNGDTNFTASQRVATETVIVSPTTATISSSNNPSVSGQPVTFNVVVTSTQGTPSGTVAFLDGTTTLATETLNSSGTASFTISNLSIGTHPIRAVYSGSTNLGTSTTSIINQVVNKDATTTTLKSTPNPSVFGATTVLVANVSANSPGSGMPTGTVVFRNGAVTIGSVPLNGNGIASLEISTSLPASSTPYALTAVYNGDANFNTSTGNLNQTINKSATSISATYAPNPSNLNQAVTINATVTPINTGAGIPSGTVTALLGSSVVGSGTLLSNGTVSFTTTNLPAGTLGIVLQYFGDSNFLGSTAPITETVNTAVSTTTLNASPNPSVVGQTVTFSVSVTSPVSSTIIPTGIITFFDGTTVLGTQSLDAFGNTTFRTSNLTRGTHAITASYSGDNSTAPSLSSIVNQVVNQTATTAAISTILNPSVYGETVTLNAQVSSNSPGSGIPTGTVTFRNGTTNIPGGTVPINSNGVATFSTSNLTVGTSSLNVVYNGDTNFTTSTSTSTSQIIAKVPTITSVTSATNPSAIGASVPISGTVLPLNNGSLTLPTGTTVTAFYGSTALGSGTLNASGQYSFSLSNLPAGTLAIEVKYPGTANFEASTITLTQTVASDTSSITIASSTNPSTFGQAVTFTSVVTLASGQTPSGTITYFDNATPIGTVNVGQPFVVSNLNPGTHPIRAVYSGSSSSSGSTSNTINQVVNLSPTTTTLASSLNPSIYGNLVTFTATVAHTNPGTPTGFVTFYDGATVLGTGDLNTAGQATLSTAALTSGPHAITAVYSGDGSFGTSTSSVLTQTVNKVPASGTITTIVSSTPNPSMFGQNVNFIANVSSSNGMPTGTVNFYDEGVLIPSSTETLYNGFAIFSISSLSPGTHNITAVYNGDTNFNPSAPSSIYMQVVQPVAVTLTTVTTLASLNNPSTYGDPVTFDVQVTSAAIPPPYPSGYVTLYSGSLPLVTLPLNATGGATYTTSALPAGNLQIIAFYSGDSTFSASSAIISQVVNAIATTTTLTSSVNPSVIGEAVTFSATVSSGSGNPVPTGTVSFFDGPVLLNTVIVNSSGVANLVISNLTIGAHSISAVYNADPNFGTSNDSIVQQVNSSGTVTTILSSSANPSNLNESVTFIANTSAINGNPTGIVNFYDGANLIGTSTLFNGLAFFTTSELTTGTHSITAAYAGNGNFNPSTSVPYIQLVINGNTILQPPRGFCGCQVVSKFLNSNYRSIVLTWSAPGVGAEPEFYRIYRDAQLTDLVGVVSACAPLTFTDPNRKKNETYTYYLVAGNQSSVSSYVTVTVGPGTVNCCSIK